MPPGNGDGCPGAFTVVTYPIKKGPQLRAPFALLAYRLLPEYILGNVVEPAIRELDFTCTVGW